MTDGKYSTQHTHTPFGVFLIRGCSSSSNVVKNDTHGVRTTYTDFNNKQTNQQLYKIHIPY